MHKGIAVEEAVTQRWVLHLPFLLHHGIEGPSPVSLVIIHYDVDEHRQKPAKHGGAVADLVPIDGAIPGRAAM